MAHSTVARSADFFGKRHEVSKLAKLKVKRVAEEIAVGGVERAVAEAVIRALEGNDPALAGGQHRGFERGLDGFKTGIAENDLAGNRAGVALGPDCSSVRK